MSGNSTFTFCKGFSTICPYGRGRQHFIFVRTLGGVYNPKCQVLTLGDCKFVCRGEGAEKKNTAHKPYDKFWKSPNTICLFEFNSETTEQAEHYTNDD